MCYLLSHVLSKYTLMREADERKNLLIEIIFSRKTTFSRETIFLKETIRYNLFRRQNLFKKERIFLKKERIFFKKERIFSAEIFSIERIFPKKESFRKVEVQSTFYSEPQITLIPIQNPD